MVSDAGAANFDIRYDCSHIYPLDKKTGVRLEKTLGLYYLKIRIILTNAQSNSARGLYRSSYDPYMKDSLVFEYSK